MAGAVVYVFICGGEIIPAVKVSLGWEPEFISIHSVFFANMTCCAWNCLFPNSDLFCINHQLQLLAFLSQPISHSDTEVQPNSHLLQSQEHNVQIKKVENSFVFISMQSLADHLLAANGSSDTQNLLEYEKSPLQMIWCPYWIGKVIEKAGCDLATYSSWLVYWFQGHLITCRIYILFPCSVSELFTSVFIM